MATVLIYICIIEIVKKFKLLFPGQPENRRLSGCFDLGSPDEIRPGCRAVTLWNDGVLNVPCNKLREMRSLNRFKVSAIEFERKAHVDRQMGKR